MPAYLDPGHLQRMNGVRHALLKLVLDSSCSEQEHVPLDELRGIVERITATVDCRRGLVVDRDPLPILCLGDVATGDAERAQAIRSVILWRVKVSRLES